MKIVREKAPKQSIVITDDVGLNRKENEMEDKAELEQLKDRLTKKDSMISYRFGIVGCGHAGSRLAESFYALGYNAIAINTATQDLVNIKIPEQSKLFMDIGVQGAAKDLDRGKEAAELYKDKISSLINSQLESSEIIIICSSVGGGSGAGSLSTVIDICVATGKPIIIMSVLPMVSEDTKTKSNALLTLGELSNSVIGGKVSSMILVDNARIEAIHSNIGQMQFYKVANKSIVEPLHMFNKFSMAPSEFKPLDSAEFGTLLLNGGGISTYGEIIISNYDGDDALASAILSSLQENLLASDLNYKQAKYVGYMVMGNENVINKISAKAITYANLMINDTFGNPEVTYKGIYQVDDIKEDIIKIYTFVSGLGIPEGRIESLRKDVNMQQEILKSKDIGRNKTLMIESNVNNTISDIEKLKKQIASKISGFGKLNVKRG